MRHSALLDRADTALLVIDVQESYRTVLPGWDRVIAAIRTILQGAALLELPILATEQYPRGLGHMASEVSALFPATVRPVEKRTMPGYVLVNMDLTDDSWQLVKGTPGVTGFVGASNEPVPLTQPEVDRLLHREVAVRAPSRAQFAIGETVKVISGPLSDFSGEIAEINEDAAKLKVLVSIFGRETPVEVGYDQVKKI